MYTRQRIQKKTRSHSSSSATETDLFGQRAAINEADLTQSQHQTPDLQTQLDTAASFGHNFGRVSVQDTTPAVIQPKLAIGAPGDKYEQEADSVASQVMSMNASASQQSIQRQGTEAEEEEVQMKPLASMITPLVQRQEAPEEEELQAKPLLQRQEAPEEEELQAKPLLQRQEASNTHGSDNLENQLNSSKGGGSPLPDDVRSFMEPRFGADFSQVRVHTDSSAIQMNQAVGAQAFTHGSDIYFGAGKSPGVSDLTAHELTHVVQQTGTKPPNTQATKADSPTEAQQVQSISRSLIQRDDTKVDTKDKSLVISLLEKNRPALETARSNALSRVAKIVKLQGDGNRAIGLLKGKLLSVAKDYDKAYGQYAKVIAAARQEAREQQEITDVIVGIAIGVAVGLAAEGVAACAVVGAIGKTATKLVGKWGAKAVGEAVGEGVEAGGGKGAKGLTEVAGQDLQPDGLKPEVLRMEIWKSLTMLHESLAKMGEGVLDQTLLMGAAEYAIGEIKSQKGGGADMTPEEDTDLVLAVLSADKQSRDLDTKLDNASKKIAALESGATKLPNYEVTQMEKDIWILWMSTLQKDCNILDIDAIEDHLKALGIVDFGWYTTDDEENEAIEKAKKQAMDVKKRRNQATGGVADD